MKKLVHVPPHNFVGEITAATRARLGSFFLILGKVALNHKTDLASYKINAFAFVVSTSLSKIILIEIPLNFLLSKYGFVLKGFTVKQMSFLALEGMRASHKRGSPPSFLFSFSSATCAPSLFSLLALALSSVFLLSVLHGFD